MHGKRKGTMVQGCNAVGTRQSWQLNQMSFVDTILNRFYQVLASLYDVSGNHSGPANGDAQEFEWNARELEVYLDQCR